MAPSLHERLAGRARGKDEADTATAAGEPPAHARSFIHDLAWRDLPDDVIHQARRCLLDLIGVAAAGSRTRSAQLAAGYAVEQLGGATRNARILFAGRRAGLAGAAFAGAPTIDAVDGHAGHPLT